MTGCSIIFVPLYRGTPCLGEREEGGREGRRERERERERESERERERKRGKERDKCVSDGRVRE